MFGSVVLLALSSVALWSAGVRGECVPVTELQANVSPTQFISGGVSICLPGDDTANPGSVKTGKLDLSTLSDPVVVPAEYTPAGAGTTQADVVALTCRVPQSVALGLVTQGANADITTIQLTCTDDAGETYFSMGSNIITGPPPEREQVKVEKQEDGTYKAVPCTPELCDPAANSEMPTDSDMNANSNPNAGSDVGSADAQGNGNGKNNAPAPGKGAASQLSIISSAALVATIAAL